MAPAMNDNYAVIFNLINQSVLIIDPPAPKALILVLERLGLSYPVITVPVNILNKLIYAL